MTGNYGLEEVDLFVFHSLLRHHVSTFTFSKRAFCVWTRCQESRLFGEVLYKLQAFTFIDFLFCAQRERLGNMWSNDIVKFQGFHLPS